MIVCNILTIYGRIKIGRWLKLMQKVSNRMEAEKIFDTNVKNKPRLGKLKSMYLIRKETLNNEKSK